MKIKTSVTKRPAAFSFSEETHNVSAASLADTRTPATANFCLNVDFGHAAAALRA